MSGSNRSRMLRTEYRSRPSSSPRCSGMSRSTILTRTLRLHSCMYLRAVDTVVNGGARLDATAASANSVQSASDRVRTWRDDVRRLIIETHSSITCSLVTGSTTGGTWRAGTTVEAFRAGVCEPWRSAAATTDTAGKELWPYRKFYP